jgi:hypothetical protein
VSEWQAWQWFGFKEDGYPTLLTTLYAPSQSWTSLTSSQSSNRSETWTRRVATSLKRLQRSLCSQPHRKHLKGCLKATSTSPFPSSSSMSSLTLQNKGNRPKCDFCSHLGHSEAKCFLKEKLMRQMASPTSSVAAPASISPQTISQTTTSPQQVLSLLSFNLYLTHPEMQVQAPQLIWHSIAIGCAI